MTYPRDLVGYGRNVPHAKWPGGARIAVQFVINYEEGGENNILHGDAASEAFLSEIVGAAAWPGMRHMNMESIYEYGSRAGFWRLHRMFTERNMPVTVYGVAHAMMRHPDAVAAMNEAGWEIASHGLKWIDYRDFSAEDEAKHIAEAVRIHAEVAGERPHGMYQGRTSANTLRLTQKKAASSIPPIATRMSYPITSRGRMRAGAPDPSSSCPTRSMRMTCVSPPRRASIRATSSSPISRTASTRFIPRARPRRK